MIPSLRRHYLAVQAARVVFSGMLAFAALSGALLPEVAAQEFYGEIVLKPVGDGVYMELQQPFGFIDARNRKWEVPAKYRTDGASIPQPLWSVIGSPFTGKYLAAAIVHDFYCDLKSRDWKDVHNVFYDAMIAKGVDSTLAKIMYYGVYRFGPRWVVDKNFSCPPGIACEVVGQPTHIAEIKVTPQFDDKEFSDTVRMIEAGKMSLSKIRATADDSFFKEGAQFDIKGRISRDGRQISIDERNQLDAVQKELLKGSLESLLRSP